MSIDFLFENKKLPFYNRLMERFVLDANLFFNMEAGLELGKKTGEVIDNITNYAQKLKNKAGFFMPPSAIKEFLSFFENKNQPVIKRFLSTIIIRSPNKNQLKFPAPVFYQLIDDIRKRSYQGLNLGEEEIEKAGQLMMREKKLDKKEFQIKIGVVIKNFRQRYRQAARAGFLDSVTDLDLIVLAKEIDGFLVSTDEGVINWGRSFGVKEVMPPAFRLRLDSLLHQGQAG